VFIQTQLDEYMMNELPVSVDIHGDNNQSDRRNDLPCDIVQEFHIMTDFSALSIFRSDHIITELVELSIRLLFHHNIAAKFPSSIMEFDHQAMILKCDHERVCHAHEFIIDDASTSQVDRNISVFILFIMSNISLHNT